MSAQVEQLGAGWKIEVEAVVDTETGERTITAMRVSRVRTVSWNRLSISQPGVPMPLPSDEFCQRDSCHAYEALNRLLAWDEGGPDYAPD